MKLVGIDEQLAKVEYFIRNWKEYKNNGKPAILLVGPQGTGKTSTAYYIAKKFGFNLIEFNMGEYRTKEDAVKIYHSCKTKGLLKKKLILLDEFDTMAITNKKNEIRYPIQALKYIYKALEETVNPVIITANEFKLIPKKVIEKCEVIEYKRDIESIRKFASYLGVRGKWIPSFRQARMIRLGSMGYSVKSLTGRIKYYLLSGIVKDPEEYDDVFSIGLMENVFKSVKSEELYEFIELLSVADIGIKYGSEEEIYKRKGIGRNYYPIDMFKFTVIDKDRIDGKIEFFEKIKEVKEDGKKRL